uniref:Protein kinase cGMP-dependent 2 n=1 Tax=Hippocampus comes TaxID=109280 RepID=A0A3Q2YUX7_HIPCM
MGNSSAKAKLSKRPLPDPLRLRVDQLEREVCKKDQELAAKEQLLKSLQDKIVVQEQALAHLVKPTPTNDRSAMTSDKLLCVCAVFVPRVCGSVKKQLVEALNRNQYLKRLEPQQLGDMVECMYPRTYQQGDYVVQQGEAGSHLFVLAGTTPFLFLSDTLVSSMVAWTAFGELAILYNCTRTASVRGKRPVNRVCAWALEREAFQNIMRRTAEMRHHEYRHFLRRLVPELECEILLDALPCPSLQEYYNKGDYVIREGEEGSTFYIIAQGKVTVTQTTRDHKSPQVINMLQKGDYFGEKALIRAPARSLAGLFAAASSARLPPPPRRKSLSRRPSQTLPPDVLRLKQMTAAFSSSRPLDHMDVVATLGVGGFGRVELVQTLSLGEDVTFALKVIKKKHVVDSRQEEHIHSERRILAEASSPFVVRMFRTFRDDKYVYMLLEACLGGEVWSLLRDRGSFDETTAKFCVGCVTEAFKYLHRKAILYRDLKPENLMLDSEGYVKLVDFGFAKKMHGGQKTWTFCGTPEYVAPEIILNKGHNLSVDFWCLGILVFELLTGRCRPLACGGVFQVSGPLDHSHFDVYPPDDKIPPDELSGWDADF